MQTWTSWRALQRECVDRRARGQRIGFVPTMGFLHSGHTSLMDVARAQCDFLVVSIFVNPLQFGPNEDLDRYPRDPEGDAQKCLSHGVDALLMPTDGDFYPSDRSTTVHVARLSDGLCGGDRPGHFDGVTTVVARLFGIVQPHVAVFGEKDYQQLAVIRRMVRDLALPIDIVGGALVRDTDGLALSSRNKYLSADQRKRALSLSGALRAVRDAVTEGQDDVGVLLALAHGRLKVDQLDYLEIRDATDLSPMLVVDRPARAFVAAKLGNTRLIDNLAVNRC